MAIQKQDVKLMKSQRLTDFEDGGGRMIGEEVQDGVANNLFPDISRLDRVYGRVSLRKAFLSVQTANSDFYYGSHAIVSNPPEDDNVHTTLFTTKDPSDLRVDAKDRVESYVSIASEYPWRPSNDQLEGQRSIVLFARPGTPRIENGETIVLKNTANGFIQYVKVSGVSAQTYTYVYLNNTTFTAELLTLDLNNPLQETFPGIEPTPYTTKALTRVHRTIVADASKYYGVKKTTQEHTPGQFELRVDSIYNQLVPTSQVETPLLDQFMNGAHTTMVRNGDVDSLTFSASRTQATNVIHLPQGILPGSVVLSVSGYTFIDHKGFLVVSESGAADGGFTGEVDYASGQIEIIRGTSWSSTVAITATPAVPLMQSFDSMEIEVTLGNRSYNYTPMLVDPLPTPGGVYISYMAQGKWYELRDDGRGVFSGFEDGMGTGTINYGTGSCIITLGALPDVDSSIIIQWGHEIETLTLEAIEEVTPPVPATISKQLQAGFKLGTIVLTWDDDGTPRTASDTAVPGTLAGDATGTIDGQWLRFIPTVTPPVGTTYNVTYDRSAIEPAFIPVNVTVDGVTVHGTLPATDISPNNIRINVPVTVKKTSTTSHWVYYSPLEYTQETILVLVDNGAGGLVASGYGDVGTVNYATGEFSFIRPTYRYYYYDANANGTYTRRSATEVYPVTSPVSARVVTVTELQTTGEINETIPDPKLNTTLSAQLMQYPTTYIVPRSALFSIGANKFYDDGLGNIYVNRSSTTGVGTLVGDINYDTGEVQLNPMSGYTGAVTVESLLLRADGFHPTKYVFRTPGAPVRDGSMFLRGTNVGGELFTATVETTGEIVSDNMRGVVDHTTGVVRVEFGKWYDQADVESELWYDPGLLVLGQYFVPEGVVPETAQYNCVLYSFIPLDPELLGIEPTRLPSDGRVPIFKAGDVVVVHHTGTHVCADPVSNTTEDVGRLRLALAEVYDANGTMVSDTLYTTDLALGTVTFANITGQGLTEPLQIKHRIEDMMLLTDVQINGRLRTAGAISHTFPALETQVSSALLFGDLASRVHKLFSQVSWTSVWSDSQIGNPTTGVYNDLQFPIQVLNNGAIEERWRCQFTSTTSFTITGEKLGQVLNPDTGTSTFSTAADSGPVNLLTGEKYFNIPQQGWGTGWAIGNVLRFNTLAANAPMWIARTTMAGPVEEPEDQFILQLRGDAN